MSSSAKPIQLIAAIGNPEDRYLQTRHNAGIWLADLIAETRCQEWRRCSVAEGHSADFEMSGKKMRLFKSGLNVNVSGLALAPLARFYRIAAEEILLLHDDLAFPPGVAKVRFGGGSAGHNGIKSIVESLGSDGFWRCRIGIGHPGIASMVTSYVLSKPVAEDREKIDRACKIVLDSLEGFCRGERERALTAIHSAAAPPPSQGSD